MNWDLYKFISVEQMMTDIGKGIGNANRHMQELSQTAINSLAVKDGSISVHFELTSKSESKSSGIDLPSLQPLLGAKTFRLTSDATTEQVVNKASIVLNIVSVAPTEEAKKPVDPGVDTGLKETLEERLGPIKYIEPVVKELLDKLQQDPALSALSKQAYSMALNALLDEYNASGDDAALRAGFIDFLVAHSGFITNYLNR
jgi:hypothetical protein